MSEKINLNTHIYLYAKNWYEETDIIEDLKVIIGKTYLLDPEQVDIFNIVEVILEITIEQILNKPRAMCVGELSELILNMDPCNKWKSGTNQEEIFELSIIRKCLSILRLTKVENIENLGNPDPDIFPLMKF